MDIQIAIEQLTYEWNPELKHGFFVQLKQGYFSDDGFERVKTILTTVKVPDDPKINRRFVELVWFIPTFVNWQKDGWITDEDKKKLDKAVQFVEDWIPEILGLP